MIAVLKQSDPTELDEDSRRQPTTRSAVDRLFQSQIYIESNQVFARNSQAPTVFFFVQFPKVEQENIYYLHRTLNTGTFGSGKTGSDSTQTVSWPGADPRCSRSRTKEPNLDQLIRPIKISMLHFSCAKQVLFLITLSRPTCQYVPRLHTDCTTVSDLLNVGKLDKTKGSTLLSIFLVRHVGHMIMDQQRSYQVQFHYPFDLESNFL